MLDVAWTSAKRECIAMPPLAIVETFGSKCPADRAG
jgi:hypothetical protein